MEKSAKERMKEKLSLAEDIKESKIEVSFNDVRQVDGRISARLNIEGLPKDTKGEESWNSSYKSIPKIFDSFAEYSKYAEKVFSMSDDEIIKLAKS